MKNILCFIGLHIWEKFFTDNKNDSVIYLECKWCKKRAYKDKNEMSYITPLDYQWLDGETSVPKYPKKPKEK